MRKWRRHYTPRACSRTMCEWRPEWRFIPSARALNERRPRRYARCDGPKVNVCINQMRHTLPSVPWMETKDPQKRNSMAAISQKVYLIIFSCHLFYCRLPLVPPHARSLFLYPVHPCFWSPATSWVETLVCLLWEISVGNVEQSLNGNLWPRLSVRL